MIFAGQGNPITRFAEPAPEQLPDKVVRFDDNDTTLRVQELPSDVQNVDAGRVDRRYPHSISVAVRQYCGGPPLDDV
jgi:hypothetical protein